MKIVSRAKVGLLLRKSESKKTILYPHVMSAKWNEMNETDNCREVAKCSLNEKLENTNNLSKQ